MGGKYVIFPLSTFGLSIFSVIVGWFSTFWDMFIIGTYWDGFLILAHYWSDMSLWVLGLGNPIRGLKENLSTTIARKIDDHFDNHQEETSAGDWVGSSHLTAERTSGKESNIFHKEVSMTMMPPFSFLETDYEKSNSFPTGGNSSW